MPITLCNVGDTVIVQRVGGSKEVVKHLNDLGLIQGTSVTIVNEFAGNLILRIKDANVALNKEATKKILVM